MGVAQDTAIIVKARYTLDSALCATPAFVNACSTLHLATGSHYVKASDEHTAGEAPDSAKLMPVLC